MSANQNKGARYEQLAATYLGNNGLTIIGQNYRTKGGEIDLIATDNTSIVFIEVKYRHQAYFGSAVEQVTQSKIRKLRRCAEHYLQTHNINQACRFDVIGINDCGPNDSNINWIKNAF